MSVPEPTVQPAEGSPAPARARVSKHLFAGLVLVAVALLALWASADLELGGLRSVGPGALPRALALLVLLIGLVFTVAALVRGGDPLGRWPLRGPFFVSLAIVAFALTIRSIGLVVAGPVVVIISGAASPETRPLELLVFAAIMTAFCIGLFRFALGLPIPVLHLPGLVTV